MKLRKLDLKLFGSLRDVSLDLDAAEPCLHVIYGPNEAGKSTALRALAGLFFGIAHNTRDAHTFAPRELRVGALLCDAQGRELYVWRRKGLKETLRAQDDKSALPAEEATWVAAGMQAATFDTQFGLSYDTLHRGAEELLGSGGDLGQSLFAAAVSGGQIRRVLEDLDKQADALFRPKGTTKLLNTAIARFEEKKKESRERATKADVFEKQQAEIESTQRICEELDAQLTALRAERIKLDRVRRILPILNRQRARQQERRGLGDVQLLPGEASEERKRLSAACRDAELRLEHARAEMERLKQEESALRERLQAALLEWSPEQCEQLHAELSLYRERARTLAARTEAQARARAELERAQRALQLPELGSEVVQRLRLPKSLEVRAREQLRQGELLRTEVGACRRKVEDTRDLLERTRRKLWQLWAPEQDALPLLGRVSLPSDEVCAHFEQRFGELERKQRELDLKRQSQLDNVARIERERAELCSQGTPPSEADLQQGRSKRDEALKALRTLISERPDDPRAVAYVDRAMALNAQADMLVDRLRSDATRVVRAERLASERTALNFELERVTTDQSELAAQRARAESEWAGLFVAAGVPVRLPREALRLLGTQRELDAQCEQLERELAAHERAHNSAQEAHRAWTDGWSALVTELDMPGAANAAELETLLTARSELLQRYDAAQAIEAELLALKREQASFEASALALAAKYLAPGSGDSAEALAAQLIHAHRQAHAAWKQVQELERSRAGREHAADQAQRELTQAERRLDELMRLAGVADLAALELAEQRSARAQQLDAELARDAADLIAECGDQDAEAIVAEAGMSIDEVRLRLDEIQDEYERLDPERLAQNQQLASKRAGLERLHEQHGAGDAAAEAALHLEEVRSLCESYIRVRLSAALLQREVEQYRERHRGPVLEAAARWFARLTLDAYAGLDVDYDDREQPQLMCVRSDEARTRLEISALSSGTRDQLYLALRLASIQHLGSQRELMPLILDDILVHFDDARARAALVALGDFAATTQVLFFTHHEHLCELATQALPNGRVRIHRLPGAAVLSSRSA